MEGQKQRKQLVSELRTIVPVMCASLLVDPLLDGGAMPPPGELPGGIL